jgi:cell division protein ZapA
MAEKQTITVLVAGRNYTLTSSDPPEYVRRVADYVDRKLGETAAMTSLTSAQGAVLTCFRLADELMKAQDENRLLRLRMEQAAEREETPEEWPAAEEVKPAEPEPAAEPEEARTEPRDTGTETAGDGPAGTKA